MTSLDSFPGPTGITDAIEAGKDLAGLVIRSAAGVPRAGVFPRTTANLLTGRADLKVDIGIFESVLVRNNALRLSGNDASATVPASPLTAPGSNTKYAVFFQKQNETTAGDANNASTIDAVQGTAFASLPTALADARALLPAGALELGHVALTPGATATNALTITQTAPFTTTAGGLLWFRTTTERDAFIAPIYTRAVVLADGFEYISTGSAWIFSSSNGTVAYTPTFSRITPGNAVVDASYTRIGQMVFCNGSIVLGSTTTMAAASGGLTLGVSFPVPAAAKYGIAGSNFTLGTAGIEKTGTQYYFAVAESQASTSEFKLYAQTGGGGANLAIHPTQPVTFAAGDILSWAIQYNAA